MKNVNRNYTCTNINILSDSQIAPKAQNYFQIKLKLVWDCLQPLLILAEHNRE
jgi:hypothetical protein